MTIRIADDPGWVAIDEWRAKRDGRSVAITIGAMGIHVQAMQYDDGLVTSGTGGGGGFGLSDAFADALSLLSHNIAERAIRAEVEAEVRRRRGAP